MKNIVLNFFVFPITLLSISILLHGCNTDGNDYFGIVETYNGRPVPPRMVPRNVIGPMPSGTLPSHQIQGIAVMDSGADYDGISSLTYLSNLLDSYRSQQEYKGDLPCHFFVDLDGHIYSGRNVVSPGEIHEGDPFLLRMDDVDKRTVLTARLNRKNKPVYDLDGYILICVLGDYDNKLITEEQEKGLYQTIAYLVYQHNIALERVYGLDKMIPESKNPGFYLQNYLQTSILTKNIPPPPGEHRFLVPEPEVSTW
jgi:hypothetical protein